MKFGLKEIVQYALEIAAPIVVAYGTRKALALLWTVPLVDLGLLLAEILSNIGLIEDPKDYISSQMMILITKEVIPKIVSYL